MGTHDSQQLKTEADILARSSRPQRNSTWIPKTRDWRYATGVIQHDDHDDAPKARSTWDVLDYDYQANSSQRSHIDGRIRSRSGTGSEADVVESTEAVPTPEPTTLKAPTDATKTAARPQVPHKPMEFRVRVWRQVKKYTRIDLSASDDDVAGFELTGLVVRMRFTRKNRVHLRETLEREVPLKHETGSGALTQLPTANRNLTSPVANPLTPATARTAQTVCTPHTLESIESLYTFPLFQRVWVDETYDFDVKFVRSTLRSADKVVDDLGGNYEWYDEAVPADAIFPPGVPLSAKEIQAFYPHHVRWKSVMIRLTKNDYRGPDIMGMQAYFRGPPNHHTTPSAMNNYQRDTVKTALPGFKTANYKGKSDRNLRTDHLKAGVFIESTRKGSSLPTFEDIARGLHRLPSGLDARGLTQCISWYLNIRNSFTPKLELNVLHTQSLTRALREPLKPFGPQNLDRNALQEWREKGTFETTLIEHKEQDHTDTTVSTTRQRRTQLRMNIDEDDVSMKLTLPIGHILTFPFLALHRVMSEALRMGIDKAEIRRAARKESEVKNLPKVESAADTTSEVSSEALDEEHDDGAKSDRLSVQPAPETPKQPYRIPKRVRPEHQEVLPASKRPYNPPGRALSTEYRPLAPAPPHSDIASSGFLGCSYDSRTPSSEYQAPRPAQDSVYGRRDRVNRRPNPRRDRRDQSGSRDTPRRESRQDDRMYPGYGLGQQVDTYRPSR